jgi:hypothetical protein
MIKAAINSAHNGSRPKPIRAVTRFPLTGALKSNEPTRSETSKGNSTGPYCGKYFFREEGERYVHVYSSS